MQRKKREFARNVIRMEETAKSTKILVGKYEADTIYETSTYLGDQESSKS
jgi:hypothetical protein